MSSLTVALSSHLLATRSYTAVYSILKATLLTASLSLLIVWFFFLMRRAFGHRSSLSLPPSPPGLPILGHVLQIPRRDLHTTFDKWASTYGDIVSINVLGKPIIILNSQKASSDVMDKMASSSAARPHYVMANELMGLGRIPTLTNDMPMHKHYRKLFSRALSAQPAKAYWPTQMQEMQKMVKRLVDDPKDFRQKIKLGVGAIMVLVVFGIQVDSLDDYYIRTAEYVLSVFVKAVTPGSYIVDVLPILKHIPAWFPGAKFKRDAAINKKHLVELRDRPFNEVRERMLAGTAIPCYTSKLMECADGRIVEDIEEQERIKLSAGVLYGAGSDTTTAGIHSFYLAMREYPHVQVKAQAEIDEVIGRDRLPTLEDRENLVYCSALLQELLRWRPVTVLTIPHAMTKDEEYRGYLLPKGATVVGNLWTNLHDPTIYPNPDEFIPERFLSDDGKTLQSPVGGGHLAAAAFGYGRRVCPGSILAEATLFAAIVTSLWTFTISKPVDANNGPVGYDHGIIRYPNEFPVEMELRSTKAIEILTTAIAQHRQIGPLSTL